MDSRVKNREIRQGSRVVLVGGMLALLLLAPGAFAARSPYEQGHTIEIKGRVADSTGQPLGSVAVVLQLSRRSFKLRSLSREKTDAVQIPTTTDDLGNYRLTWGWDSYYDTFEILVAVPITRSGSDDFDVLQTRDITSHVVAGTPVVMSLTVEDTPYLQWLKRFLADLASEDEQRIFGEMGRPDRIDRVQGGDSAAYPGTSWWYFEVGKVFRFRDGALEQVVHFDPVTSPPDT